MRGGRAWCTAGRVGLRQGKRLISVLSEEKASAWTEMQTARSLMCEHSFLYFSFLTGIRPPLTESHNGDILREKRYELEG
jgi:hypothetical protein